MLSSMWRVGKRRVRGFHMIRNETGEAWEALRKSEKKGPECNRKQPLNKSLQQLLTTNTTEKKRRSKRGHRSRTTGTDQTRFQRIK